MQESDQMTDVQKQISSSVDDSFDTVYDSIDAPNSTKDAKDKGSDSSDELIYLKD